MSPLRLSEASFAAKLEFISSLYGVERIFSHSLNIYTATYPVDIVRTLISFHFRQSSSSDLVLISFVFCLSPLYKPSLHLFYIPPKTVYNFSLTFFTHMSHRSKTYQTRFTSSFHFYCTATTHLTSTFLHIIILSKEELH